MKRKRRLAWAPTFVGVTDLGGQEPCPLSTVIPVYEGVGLGC
jgi:hypothetical protein